MSRDRNIHTMSPEEGTELKAGAWYVVSRKNGKPLYVTITPASSPSVAWSIWLDFFRNASPEVVSDCQDRKKWVARRFELQLLPVATTQG